MTEPAAPVIAVHVGPKGTRTVTVTCPYCRHRHVHGWPTGTAAPGVRVAHCVSGPAGRYRITGWATAPSTGPQVTQPSTARQVTYVPRRPPEAVAIRVQIGRAGIRMVLVACPFCRREHLHGWPTWVAEPGVLEPHCGGAGLDARYQVTGWAEAPVIDRRVTE